MKTMLLALWLALCPAVSWLHAAVDQPAPSLGSAIGWTLAKRAGVSLGGGVAGFAVGLGARALLLRALAGVALPALVPALGGILTVATLAVGGVMLANWAYNAYRDAQVRRQAREPTPAQAAGAEATDDATPARPALADGARPLAGGGGGLLGVQPEPLDGKRLAEEFPR